MRVLMLVNWKIYYLDKDDNTIQGPDKVVKGKEYWFFKYWPEDVNVDVIDFTKLPLLHNLEKKLLKFYVAQPIKFLFKRKNYDLIISHSAQSAVLCAFVRSLMGKKTPPHFVIDPASFNGGRDNFLELLPIKISANSIAGLIYHATIQKRYYEKHLPSLSKRSCFVPFGVDTDFFTPLNLPKENYVIAFGELKRDYNTLFKAWLKLAPRGIDLIIVGVNKSNLLKSKISSGVFLHKRVSIDKLKVMIAKSLFVILPLPYYEYSYGQMSLLQSMSMGKTVIVTETPGISDYIKNGIDAIFVEPYDPADLAEKIAMCLNDVELVKKIGKQARLTILNEYNEKLMAKRIYSFIKKFA